MFPYHVPFVPIPFSDCGNEETQQWRGLTGSVPMFPLFPSFLRHTCARARIANIVIVRQHLSLAGLYRPYRMGLSIGNLSPRDGTQLIVVIKVYNYTYIALLRENVVPSMMGMTPIFIILPQNDEGSSSWGLRLSA